MTARLPKVSSVHSEITKCSIRNSTKEMTGRFDHANDHSKKLAERQQEGDVELIDVRTPLEFREVHASAARNVPLDSLDPASLMQSRSGSSDEPVYIICRAGARGEQACQRLIESGYGNVVNVEGGTQAWEACGLPVVRGKESDFARASSSHHGRHDRTCERHFGDHG